MIKSALSLFRSCGFSSDPEEAASETTATRCMLSASASGTASTVLQRSRIKTPAWARAAPSHGNQRVVRWFPRQAPSQVGAAEPAQACRILGTADPGQGSASRVGLQPGANQFGTTGASQHRKIGSPPGCRWRGSTRAARRAGAGGTAASPFPKKTNVMPWAHMGTLMR